MNNFKEEENKAKIQHGILTDLLQLMHDGMDDGRGKNETGILLTADKISQRLLRIQGTCTDDEVSDEEIQAHYEYLSLVLGGLDSYIEAHKVKEY